MRRLIGYITTCIAMLLAIVVTATPVITHLNTGREFTESRNYREIVFNIGENSSEEENENRASVVADEMRARLKNFEVEDYSIKVQGNDTVTVSLNMDKTQFNYTAKYLTFSGESFAFVGSNGEIKSEHKLFNPSDVKVEFKGDAKIPVVIIPLTSEGKADIEAIIEKFGETAHDHEHEEGEEEPQNLIYLWSNFDVNTEDLDSISGDKIDPKCRDKVIMAFNDNPWNPDSKEEKTELMYMCATGKEDNPSELDVSGLKDDNDRASYLSNMLKASKYDFEITCPTATVTKEAVDYFDNARVLDASAEKLIGFDANAVINFKSKTFIV